MGEPEILLGGLLTPAQEAMGGEPTMTDEFDKEAYRASLAEAVIALAKADAGAAVLRASITRALAGCPFCRMGQCRADAHLWLTDALTDTQAGTRILIRLGELEHERDQALELEVGVQDGLDDLAAEGRELEAVREKLAAAERQRDTAAAALEDSEKLLAAATLAGQQILDRLHGLETAILEYGRWVWASFPADLEQSDAEQHLLDLAVALEAPPAAEGD